CPCKSPPPDNPTGMPPRSARVVPRAKLSPPHLESFVTTSALDIEMHSPKLIRCELAMPPKHGCSTVLFDEDTVKVFIRAFPLLWAPAATPMPTVRWHKPPDPSGPPPERPVETCLPQASLAPANSS